jgi:hypothetical protein
MNYQTNYPINEELITSSTKQAFLKVYLKKKWVVISLFFLMSICAFIPDDPDGTGKIVGGVLSGVTFLLIATWIKTYFAMMSNALTQFKITGEGTLNLSITDEVIDISTETGSRKIMQDKITSLVETKDYVILMADKLPLFCIPKRSVDAEVVSWFLNRYTS